MFISPQAAEVERLAGVVIRKESTILARESRIGTLERAMSKAVEDLISSDMGDAEARQHAFTRLSEALRTGAN